MIYMYYGFFALLLLVTAPLWLSVPVLVLSWWGMNSARNLERDLRTPLADFRL